MEYLLYRLDDLTYVNKELSTMPGILSECQLKTNNKTSAARPLWSAPASRKAHGGREPKQSEALSPRAAVPLSSRCFRWSSYLPFLLLSGVAKDISSFNKCLVSAHSVSSRCCVVRCVGEYLTKIVEKIDNKQDKHTNTVITTCRKKGGGLHSRWIDKGRPCRGYDL